MATFTARIWPSISTTCSPSGSDHDWAILGAGVRAPDAAMRDALLAQDCLSTVIELDPAGKTARRIGAMIDFLPSKPTTPP